MIYSIPANDAALDQGDIFEACPIALIIARLAEAQPEPEVALLHRRVIIVTQTCDLAQDKTESVLVSQVFDAADMVADGTLKASDIKGPIRSNRAWGLYFLPANDEIGFAELIVDLRLLQVVPRQVLEELRILGKRRARLTTPYREHLAKHFADTYSRIGLPQPYLTLP